MADIRNNFVGIKSPNPFWLASAPPTRSGVLAEPWRMTCPASDRTCTIMSM